MPKWLRLSAVIAVVTLLVAVMGPLSSLATTVESSAESAVAQLENEDDEVVLLSSAGYVVVDDPVTPSGAESADWTSPDGGWTFVTTGDFDGDGDDEIVALGGTRAKIYNPYPLGGIDFGFDKYIGGHNWYNGTAADIDADGRDELILLRDDNNSSSNIYCHLVVYDWNHNTNEWAEIQNLGYGTKWADVAAGNFLYDRAQLVLTRQQVPTTEGKVLVMNAQTGQTITEADYGYYFHALATGDFNRDGRDEIAASRNVIATTGAPNIVIWKVNGVGQGFSQLGDMVAGAAFMYLAAGDMDADGADEVALMRNVPGSWVGLFHLDLYGSQVILEEPIAEGWTDIQVGDITGNGRAEVLILKSSLVRAYNGVSRSVVWTKSGSYRSVFALGNIDGVGIQNVPVLGVSPQTLSFTMNYRGTLPAAKQVQVTNEGSESLNWTATKSAGATWLTVNPTSGTAPSSFQVSVNTSQINPGSYSAEIVVDGGAGTDNSPQTVNVSLTVTGPNLSVSPTSLSFDMDYGNPAPPAQYLNLDNSAGTGPIDWSASISPEVDWLQVAPAAGQTPGTMEVSIVADNVQAGTHTTSIVVDGGSQTGNSPFTVPVTLAVRAPTMQVSPNTYSVISQPDAAIPQKIVRVTQEGGGSGAINWVATIIFKDQWDALKAKGDAVEEVYVTEHGIDAVVDGEAVHIDSVDWLTIFPLTGTTPTDVHLAFNTVGQELGVYKATVVVDAGAGVINRLGWCDVTMTLMEPITFLPQINKAN